MYNTPKSLEKTRLCGVKVVYTEEELKTRNKAVQSKARFIKSVVDSELTMDECVIYLLAQDYNVDLRVVNDIAGYRVTPMIANGICARIIGKSEGHGISQYDISRATIYEKENTAYMVKDIYGSRLNRDKLAMVDGVRREVSDVISRMVDVITTWEGIVNRDNRQIPFYSYGGTLVEDLVDISEYHDHGETIHTRTCKTFQLKSSRGNAAKVADIARRQLLRVLDDTAIIKNTMDGHLGLPEWFRVSRVTATEYLRVYHQLQVEWDSQIVAGTEKKNTDMVESLQEAIV